MGRPHLQNHQQLWRRAARSSDPSAAIASKGPWQTGWSCYQHQQLVLTAWLPWIAAARFGRMVGIIDLWDNWLGLSHALAHNQYQPRVQQLPQIHEDRIISTGWKHSSCPFSAFRLQQSFRSGLAYYAASPCAAVETSASSSFKLTWLLPSAICCHPKKGGKGETQKSASSWIYWWFHWLAQLQMSKRPVALCGNTFNVGTCWNCWNGFESVLAGPAKHCCLRIDRWAPKPCCEELRGLVVQHETHWLIDNCWPTVSHISGLLLDDQPQLLPQWYVNIYVYIIYIYIHIIYIYMRVCVYVYTILYIYIYILFIFIYTFYTHIYIYIYTDSNYTDI